ncbi:MAG: NAD-dependent DNA ligase LigA, partial [Clostridiales bacterium]|nr:NAD-dependent DNA ligase LigA [Clostridiales bacterium]
MSDTASRMRALVDEINRASYRYYVLDEPAMPDKQWDRLYDELKKLEAESGVRLPDSPTRRVGGEPLPAFQQHRHINRLWSLDKVQTPEELSAWFARARALHAKTPSLPPLSFAVEYKYDGLTLNLTYRDGLLEGAVTRGNGVVGEQVLPQARTVRGIPLSIPYRGLMEIHGECFMRLSVLAQHNRVSAEKLKNARNAAAGGLRSLDPAVTAQRRLDARFYEIGTIESPPYTDQEGMNRFITENGIPASPLLFVGSGEDDVAAAIRSVEERRDSLDFLIDGAVIKITDLETRAALGYTDKFPRWAVAWKFAAE